MDYLQETKEWGLSLIDDFINNIPPGALIALKVTTVYQSLVDSTLNDLELTLENLINLYSNEFHLSSEQYNQIRLELLFLLLKFKHALHPFLQQNKQMAKRWDAVNRTPQRMPSSFLKRSPCKSDSSELLLKTPPSSPAKPMLFSSPSKSNNPLCRICECEISPSCFDNHNIHCLKCHSLKIEWQELNDVIISEAEKLGKYEREILMNTIQGSSFTSSLSLFLSKNLINQCKNGSFNIPESIVSYINKRHALMEEGTSAAMVATDSITTNDAPNMTDGYSMPPLPPPRLSDFKIVAPISRGAFGSVFICQRVTTGDIFALKVIPADDFSMKNEVLDTEREVMCRALHPSVISLYWSFRATSTVFFVMSFARGGDLYALLESVGSLDEEVAIFYIAELIIAVEYLHSLNVVHCDLKPDNILINDSGHLQLTDFGLSKFGAEQREISRSLMFRFAPSRQTKCDDLFDRQRKVVGTPHYISPESLLRSDYSPAVDWWAVGVIAYELVCGEPPFLGDNEAQVFSRIVAGKFDWPADKEISPKYKEVVHDLLQMSADKRPDAGKLKTYEAFKDIDWSTIYSSSAPFVPELSDSFDLSYFENTRLQNSMNVDIFEELKCAAGSRERPDEWCCTNIAALAEKNRDVVVII